MMNRIIQTCSLLGLAIAIVLNTGCATSRPLPATYHQQQHSLNYAITKIPDKPKMRDSGEGGLIGLMVNSGRSSRMKEHMSGIQGETVKELLRQALASHLAGSFTLVDSAQDLQMDIVINTFGWFCSSTVLGIRTGAYQFEIMGIATIRDLKLKNKKVAYTQILVQKPLGNKPGEQAVQEALLQAVEEFASHTTAFFATGKAIPPPGKKARS